MDKKIFIILSFDVQAKIQSIAVDIKLWRYYYACKLQMEDPMKRTTIMLPEDLKMRALKHGWKQRNPQAPRQPGTAKMDHLRTHTIKEILRFFKKEKKNRQLKIF